MKKLSKKDRLLLRNQYEILSVLKPNYGYEKYIEMLEYGYEYEYNFDDIIFESMSIDNCKYVYKILNMFDFLQLSFSKLTNPIKIKEDDVIFNGFDANSNIEVGYLGYVRFLIEELNKFNFIKKIDYNSHAPMIETYDRMYSIYEKIGKKLATTPIIYLTEDELCEICFWTQNRK